MKKLRFKEFMFILPLLVLLGIFSIWPILRAFSYTFFDYRLNDESKAGLYLKARYNVRLSNENAEYILMYLDEDKETLPDDGQAIASQIETKTQELVDMFKDNEDIIKLSGNINEKTTAIIADINNLSKRLSNDYDFTNEENMVLLADDLNKCLIKPNFIGLQGYSNLLKDKRVFRTLGQTSIFTVCSIILELGLGLLLAMIMNKNLRGRGLIRTSALIPWAIPTAVAALMWSYLYDGGSGIIAKLLESVGILGASEELLLTSGGAMVAAIFSDVWKTTPYMALLLLAGLQTIPGSLYESSMIDGASKIQTFFKITLPLLKPSMLVALLFRTLDAFRVFDLIYVLTGGGPGGSTETLSIYSYKLMFGQTNFGYGSIVVLFMFVCVALIATLFVKVLGADLMDK